MAVALEFINLLVPIELIRKKYSGGWEQCLVDYASSIGRRIWYDDHLFRDGAMSPRDMKSLVDHWTSLGFEPTKLRAGKPAWNDLCVVEPLFGGLTLPCEWYAFDETQSAAYLAGTIPGPAIGRSHFR